MIDDGKCDFASSGTRILAPETRPRWLGNKITDLCFANRFSIYALRAKYVLNVRVLALAG